VQASLAEFAYADTSAQANGGAGGWSGRNTETRVGVDVGVGVGVGVDVGADVGVDVGVDVDVGGRSTALVAVLSTADSVAVLKAYAGLGLQPPPELFEQLAVAIATSASSIVGDGDDAELLNERDLAAVFYSFAHLGVSPEPHLGGALADRARTLFVEGKPTDGAWFIHACGGSFMRVVVHSCVLWFMHACSGLRWDTLPPRAASCNTNTTTKMPVSSSDNR
jgi:hypothetical protein